MRPIFKEYSKMNTFIERPASNKSIGQRKLVLGVGINDADYITNPQVNGKKVMCPYYTRWTSMIKRCYCPKSLAKRPTYTGCTVSPEWHTFSVFKAWMQQQDWQGQELDKDLLVQGNKVYSPEYCVFVPQAINLLLNEYKARRGDYPIGVGFHKPNGRFRAYCQANGKLKHIGMYDTSEAASEAYKKFKYKVIAEVALTQPEPIRSALLAYRILD